MKEKGKTKRLGRPPKPPISGQRVSLGLRVSPELKRALGAAAKASGRSLSQEAELRLENSLKSDSSLMLIQGHRATSVFFYDEKVLVPVGYKAVAMPVGNSWDWTRVIDHFREQWYRGSFDEEGRVKETVLWEMREDPDSDEGVSLGLRVTPELKRALDQVAEEGDISQSREAELRLENSLNSDKQLMLVQGHRAAPITFDTGKMLIPITVEYGGSGPGPWGEYRLTDEIVTLPISPKDQAIIQEYFRTQWPKPEFDELVSDEEMEAIADYAGEIESDIARGK
jgi:predicted HicB family RNase H-like nuclease